VLIESLNNVDQGILEMVLDGTIDLQLGEIAHLSSARKELAAYKLDAALPLILEFEAQNQPIVVFSAHRAPVEALAKRGGWAGLYSGARQRDKTIEDFQDGKLKGVAATIQASGLGITLTRSHHAIFLDRTYVPGDNLQAEDRVCRIGQDRGVIIIDVVCDHPVDLRVAQILHQKKRLIEATTGQVASKSFATTNYGYLADQLETIAQVLRRKRHVDSAGK
jgi:SNF2 family DNA or RNA helicase